MVRLHPTVPATLLAALALLACDAGPPTLEGYSEDTFVRSVDEVRASLDASRRPMFDSLLGLVLHDGRVVGDTADPVTERALRALPQETRRELSGVRMEGLREVANHERRGRLMGDTAMTRVLIESARKRRETFRQLRRLEVVDTRWWRPDRVGAAAALIATLENNLDAALSRARFHAEFRTPGRTVPYNEGTVTIRFPGGIEPGERRTFRHEISLFRNLLEHSMSEVPASTTLRLTPFVLYGPEGGMLVNARGEEPPDDGYLDSLRRALERQQAELESLGRDSAATE